MDIFISICFLLAGIAVFLLGIKLISNGLEKGAGKGIKKMFARIGDNRFAGAGIGAGATVTIQSSTAVTVMVVGFANAGVITLLQATAIIMGANVGTTFTAFFGAMGGLPIAPVFMMSGIVGVSMMMFGKKPKIKIIGEIITGLAIVFVGMNLMSGAFPRDGRLRSGFQSVFVALSGNPVGPLLLMLIGAAFTATVQSSTAATSMAVVMATEGVLPLEAGIFIILGANIGTCLTALVASIGASKNAKRAALTHLVYNIIGAIIFLPLLWALRSQTTWLLMTVSRGSEGWAAAFFHLFYNILLFALLIGFVGPLTKLVTLMVPSRGEVFEELRLYYIDDKVFEGVYTNAEAREAAKTAVLNEIKNMADLANDNIERAFRAVLNPNAIDKEKIISNEQKINFINKGIGRYLVRLSKDDYSDEDDKLLNSLHHVVSDIERIGDHAMNFLEEAEEMREGKITFSESAVSELKEMRRLVAEMHGLALEIFGTRDRERLDEVTKMRRAIGDKKRKLNFKHISRLNKDECNVEAGVHFYAVVSSLENIREHLTNVAYSIRNTKGAQYERLKQLSREKAKKRATKKKVYW